MNQLYAAAMLLMAFSGVVAAQTSKENMVFDRGQTRARSAQPGVAREIQGLLVDSGCMNRSLANLRRAPEAEQPKQTDQSAPSAPAGSNTEAERAGAMAHQVADQKTRQPDSSCAITGQTSSFGVLLDDGEYLTLDEGGNTKASEAIRGTTSGREMLNGSGAPIKPKATLRGVVANGRAVVESIKLN